MTRPEAECSVYRPFHSQNIVHPFLVVISRCVSRQSLLPTKCKYLGCTVHGWATCDRFIIIVSIRTQSESMININNVVSIGTHSEKKNNIKNVDSTNLELEVNCSVGNAHHQKRKCKLIRNQNQWIPLTKANTMRRQSKDQMNLYNCDHKGVAKLQWDWRPNLIVVMKNRTRLKKWKRKKDVTSIHSAKSTISPSVKAISLRMKFTW